MDVVRDDEIGVRLVPMKPNAFEIKFRIGCLHLEGVGGRRGLGFLIEDTIGRPDDQLRLPQLIVMLDARPRDGDALVGTRSRRGARQQRFQLVRTAGRRAGIIIRHFEIFDRADRQRLRLANRQNAKANQERRQCEGEKSLC